MDDLPKDLGKPNMFDASLYAAIGTGVGLLAITGCLAWYVISRG